MKRLLVIGILAASAAGCARRVEPAPAPDGSIRCVEYGRAGYVDFMKATIEGHDYIVAFMVKGVSLVHSESCPCRAAGN